MCSAYDEEDEVGYKDPPKGDCRNCEFGQKSSYCRRTGEKLEKVQGTGYCVPHRIDEPYIPYTLQKIKDLPKVEEILDPVIPQFVLSDSQLQEIRENILKDNHRIWCTYLSDLPKIEVNELEVQFRYSSDPERAKRGFTMDDDLDLFESLRLDKIRSLEEKRLYLNPYSQSFPELTLADE